MKKIFLTVVLSLTACSFVQTYDTEFKNPVFNQPLEPQHKTEGYVYLTPTSVDFRGVLDKSITIYTGKCDLIENKQDRITLKCKGKWDDGSDFNSYFTYVIKDIPLFTPNCLRILEFSYDNPKEFPKDEFYSSKYCVTPPKEMISKSD